MEGPWEGTASERQVDEPGARSWPPRTGRCSRSGCPGLSPPGHAVRGSGTMEADATGGTGMGRTIGELEL